MSEIPTRVTEQQFARFFDPYLSHATRGFVSQIPRYKVFNYILYRLHTGCQWDEIPIEQQVGSKKKKSAIRLFTLSSRSGAMTAV
jgi:transposase